MSPLLPAAIETTPPSGPGQWPSDGSPPESPDPWPEPPARDIVRLYQCRLCSLPLRGVVTLPCGKSVCRRCLPDAHVRSRITYPARPDRLQGFRCPFAGCAKEHALGDCSNDVILNSLAGFMNEQVDRFRHDVAPLGLNALVLLQDPWGAAGIRSLRGTERLSAVLDGGRLLATWILAEQGGLAFEADVSYDQALSPSGHAVLAQPERELVRRVRSAARAQVDCQVCYALFHDPLTTGCGHTFCRSCLQRSLDHSRHCPLCRSRLTLNPQLTKANCPPNESLCKIIQTYWPDELAARQDAVAAEAAGRHKDFDTPLFVCTLSFPMMPTFLHIFEPRYRLMLRRALEGDRTFGMVLPRRSCEAESPGRAHFRELGTMLKIVNVQFYPDGRSLIETVGLWRFRVLRHGSLDGYAVGNIERVDDVSLEDEEAVEASEVAIQCAGDEGNDGERPHESKSSSSSSSTCASPKSRENRPEQAVAGEARGVPRSASDLDGMSTQSLMRFATAFVERMRAQSVPWLTERMLAIYGDCPDDPAVFAWWFASMLPVRELEKYRLLGTGSVRERLKICCAWVVEWEARRWSVVFSPCSCLPPSIPWLLSPSPLPLLSFLPALTPNRLSHDSPILAVSILAETPTPYPE